MHLTENTVREYLDALISDAPVPGGGTASALSGAQGCALVAMVAGLTMGRKRYAQHEELCRDIYEKAASMARELAELAERDALAYGAVSSAIKLPRETLDEQELRSAAISAANARATQVPFEVMRLAVQGLELCGRLVGRSNTNAASDLEVAALQLSACVRGAWANVLINIPGLSDINEAARFTSQGGELVSRSRQLAFEICSHGLSAEEAGGA